MRNLRNGRGLCLPDQTVETQDLASLRKKQRPTPQNQDVPQNNANGHNMPIAKPKKESLMGYVKATGIVPLSHGRPTVVLLKWYCCPTEKVLERYWECTKGVLKRYWKGTTEVLRRYWEGTNDIPTACISPVHPDRRDGEVLVGVQTLHATSLRKKQPPTPQNQDMPQNNVCDIRRGVSHTPTCEDRMLSTRGRKHSAPTWAVFIMIFICCLFHNAALAQSHEEGGAAAGVGEIVPLRVGDYVPEGFWDHNALVYIQGDSVEVKLSQFKGKTLLLDFWATWCGYCIDGFPRLIEIKDQYHDRMNVLLVNSKRNQDTFDKIHGMRNDVLRENNLPSIIEDEYLTDLFPHVPIPHYVWINPKGRVAGITFREFVHSAQVEAFLKINKQYENNN